MNLTNEQKKVMATAGHQLVIGGPGSGKTTVSILKAAEVSKTLSAGQRVLFLSFARATVSRVIEAVAEYPEFKASSKSLIEVNTYHAFFWKIIKTHGYLLGLPRKLQILTTSAEAVALADIRSDYPSKNKITPAQKKEKESCECDEKIRLAMQDGAICFDLFAEYATQILQGSHKIRELISLAYPYIIFDEFQDTNDGQWEVVKSLGVRSTLMALADPEQRIFDFIGADPERLNHFKQVFSPHEFDFKGDNHRSHGTDIAVFGNDILSGRFQGPYKGITCKSYPPNPNQAFFALKLETLNAIKRLKSSRNPNWSLAVLVPTKKMMREVSNIFSKAQPISVINHTASIDMNGVILAAEIIGFMLQGNTLFDSESEFIDLICNFYQGKGGDAPSKKSIDEAATIKKGYKKILTKRQKGETPPAASKLLPILEGYNAVKNLIFLGDPELDWKSVRDTFENSNCPRLKKIATEAKNLRLLNRGTQLRDSLSQNWRNTGRYSDALIIVKDAFVQEHFATAHKPETGVIVMNMHKAKGKQFDEVIIFEGWPIRSNGKIINLDRIVWNNLEKNIDSCKQNLMVSITRAKSHTTILTPASDPCILLTR